MGLDGVDEPQTGSGAGETLPAPGTWVRFEGSQWQVAGFDPSSGDVILDRPGYGETWAGVGRPLPGPGDPLFSPLAVGGKQYYRDRAGNIYKIVAAEGQEALLYPHHQMRAVAVTRLNQASAPAVSAMPAPAQSSARVKVANREIAVPEGEQVAIGRKHQTIADGNVSRNHAVVGTDQKGTYIADSESVTGTWVRPAGEADFRMVAPGQRYYVRAGDEVRLGGAKGTEVHFILPQAEVPAPPLVPDGGKEVQSSRQRRERAARELSALLDFQRAGAAGDEEACRRLEQDCGLNGAGTSLPLEQGLREIASRRYGAGGAEETVRLLEEDPLVRRLVEQAFVERLLLGEDDTRLLNLVIKTGHLRVENQFIECAYPKWPAPQWFVLDDQSIDGRIHMAFSARALTPAVLGKIRALVGTYAGAGGRAKLAAIGLRPPEVDGYLARAAWFDRQGRFPPVSTINEVIAAFERRNPGRRS